MDFDILGESLSSVHFIWPVEGGVIFAFIVAAVLLGVSAFASGSEIAFFSLTPSDMNELDTDNNVSDDKIKRLLDDNERTLATILITNNFVNVTIIMLLNYVIANVINFGNSYVLQFLCITVLLTFLLLLFGEILPKIFARQRPLVFCRRFANGVLFFQKLFWPIGSLLLKSGGFAERFLHKENHVLSVDELGHALELTDKSEIKDEQRMLQGIIKFGDETAKDVMTCRKDIVDISIDESYPEVLKNIVDNNYSRIPVYRGNVDKICGILYIKDLLPHLTKPVSFRWQSLIRPPYFVPETKKIDDLLREFQNNKVHIAIVVDEFGGTSGIVTLEDIMEEIVGEINDEYDEEESCFVRLSKGTYIFDGKTLLTDFCRIVAVDGDFFSEIEGEADTIAGLILELKGDFPKLNETINYKNFTFTVVEIEERRLAKIKVVIGDLPAEKA